jgi:hypothetical protein
LLLRIVIVVLVLTVFAQGQGEAQQPTPPVEFYNVTKFGGSVQAAINAASATSAGGVVRLPCGDTVVGQTVVIDKPGITLEGCGPQGSRLVATFASGDIVRFGQPALPFARCGGIRDLSIQSSVPRTAGSSIFIGGCEHGIIDNVRIEAQGGHGIRFADGGGLNSKLATVWFVRNLDIEIRGAFTGIWLDGGTTTRYFTDLFVRGNYTPGSIGMHIADSRGDYFKDIEVVQFERGVLFQPLAGQEVVWDNFVNVLADTNRSHGFQFNPAGGLIRGVSCVRCWSGTNGARLVDQNGVETYAGDLNARGILIQGGEGLTFTDSRVINNGGHGFEVLASARDIEISGGIFTGNCQAGNCQPGTTHGIVMVDTQGFRIQGVRSGAAVGMANVQGLGIFLTPNTNQFIVTGNDLRTNRLGGLSGPAKSATRIIDQNLQ